MRAAGRVGAVGLEIAAAVIVSLLIGSWADSKLGTGPWLAVAGIVVGSIAGFKALYRTIKVMQAQDEKADEDQRRAQRRRDG